MLTLDERFTFQGQSVAWGSIGDGAPVILIHGFPWSAQAWRNIAPWIAKTHKVYFFDMLGCGLSEKHENQTVSENVQSDLLEALVEHWQLDKPQARRTAWLFHQRNRIRFIASNRCRRGSPVRLTLLRTCCTSRGSFRWTTSLCT